MAAASAAVVNAVNDCFSIGSTVLCTTCFKDEVEGEVLAFDHNTKMLILKCHSKTAEELSDVYVMNLSLCSNVQVIKECNGNFIDDPQKLNLEQVKMRLRKTVERRQDFLKSKNADVSPEAQELYRAIAKQLGYNEVSWQGQNIQILNEVTVSPPYRVDNVVSSSDNDTSCNYIKRIIKQFFNTRPSPSAQENSHAAGGGASSASVSPTSSSLSSSNAASGSPVPAN
ncbi:LSM12 homolog A [Drosophila nasuta]|uniref:LSM12 homolog A n=1 Tax=Drosophila albomicans TaxID=7291 RepID=A0A6P8W5U0_DROAB|nr:LSM12 homolog A [Drosophila albomicans]XP_060663736.1 LSM12 homolog A [Drosophila nasuta]